VTTGLPGLFNVSNALAATAAARALGLDLDAVPVDQRIAEEENGGDDSGKHRNAEP